MTADRLSPPPIARAAEQPRRWPFSAGRRGLWLLAAGLLWIVPAWFDLRMLAGLVVWDLSLLAAWVVDARRLPRAGALGVERSWSGPLGHGMPAEVRLRFANGGRHAVRAWLTDTPPPSLRADPPTISTAAPPGRQTDVSYTIAPSERGDAAVGDVLVRCATAWDLATRWSSAPLAQTVRVYPNLREAERQAFRALRAPRISTAARRARQHAVGREFEALRDRQDGDDLRDVCWTASARRGRLVTRVYRPERSQVVWIVVDAGRLSRGRSGPLGKLDQSVNAALALSEVALLSGDRVGLLAYGQRVSQRVMPGRGSAHLRTLVETLAVVRAEPVEGDHVGAAAAVQALQRSRALVVWLTEIAETAGIPDVIESGQRMVPRHLVVLAVPRPVELAGLAGSRPDTAGAMYRVMAAQESVERRHALLHSLRQRGVQALEWTPGGLGAALVDRYLSIKARNAL